MKIQGQPISCLSDVESLSAEDLFLVVTPTDVNNISYEDAKTKYETLCRDVASDISSRYGLRSMAWEDEDDYSLTSHDHDGIYDKTTIKPSREYGTHVATFIIEPKQRISVYAPTPVVYFEDDPYVGELRFTADRTARPVDVNSPSFDGWVYADGESYTNVNGRFDDAMEAFGGQNGSFSVPLLTDFIKGVNGGDVQKHMDGNTPLKPHSHPVHLQFSNANLTGEIELSANRNGEGPDFHGHTKNDEKHTTTIKLDVDVHLFGGGTLGNSGTNEVDQTHPSFNYMPVMIYIGGVSSND